MASPAAKTPYEIAYAAGAKFLNSKVDSLPDENELAELCEIGPGDDSLAVVKECVFVSELVRWVIGCRRRATVPARLPTEFECIASMREIAKKKAAQKL